MSASTAEFLWNPAEIGYFNLSRSGNAIGNVYQFINQFITVAFATNFIKYKPICILAHLDQLRNGTKSFQITIKKCYAIEQETG